MNSSCFDFIVCVCGGGGGGEVNVHGFQSVKHIIYKICNTLIC